MKTYTSTVTESRHQTKQAFAEYSELNDFLNILRLLIREPSVVGCEDSFFRVLRRELEEIGVKLPSV